MVQIVSQVWLSADEVVRFALRDEGTYPLRVFMMIKEVRDGTSSDNFLGSKDIIYQPLMSMFYRTIPIQIFPKLNGFSPRALF